MPLNAGVSFPGGQALLVEGEDDALAVDLRRGQPAQAPTGVGGYKGAARGVATEPGQCPHLAEAVGEDDAVDMCVEGGPGLLGLTGKTEITSAYRELLRRLRKFNSIEGVPLVAAQVDLFGVRLTAGRHRRCTRGLGDELVDEAVGGVGVLLDHAAEGISSTRTECAQQDRPVRMAADGLRRVLLRPRGSAD